MEEERQRREYEEQSRRQREVEEETSKVIGEYNLAKQDGNDDDNDNDGDII